MKSKSIYAFVLLLSVVASAHADWHVWTVTETRHVLRSEPPGHDRTVEVAAARNEWVSFQVLLRSDEPVEAVRLEADELHGPGGATLRTSESRCYRQQQLQECERLMIHKRYIPDPSTSVLIVVSKLVPFLAHITVTSTCLKLLSSAQLLMLDSH